MIVNNHYLSRFGSFTQGKDSFRASSLSRRRQILDFLEHDLIQIEVICQSRKVASLLPDDLCCGVLDDSRAVESWLFFRSDKVLQRLADRSDARVALAGRAEELNDFGCQNGRIQQGPT